MSDKVDGILAVTPEGRIAFPNFFEAKKIKRNGREVGDPVYTGSFLFKPDQMGPADRERWEGMMKAARDVAERKWPGRPLNDLKLPFKDGNKEADRLMRNGKKEGQVEFYRGHILLKTKSKYQPGVVDIDRNDILDPKKVYGGCYGVAEVNFVPYTSTEDDGKDGVTCYLNFVMKTREGDRISGRSAADVFSGIGGQESQESPSAGAPKEEEALW